MTMMPDLPEDLMREIFSRLPLTSLKAMRLTCKKWNELSKNLIIGKDSTIRKKFPGFMTIGSRLFSMDLDLQGTHNDRDFIVPSIKKVSKLDQVNISSVFHCDGLLLCVTKDENRRLMVCNPYLGQMKWIRHINKLEKADMHALGYDNNGCNHKILRLLDYSYYKGYRSYEIYDFNSDSWRVLDVKLKWDIYGSCVSLKGNTYFVAREETRRDCLLSFDFTSESFGPSLSLPFDSYSHVTGNMTVLSCVSLRDEQLSVLSQETVVYHDHEKFGMMEIWITTKIEPNDVSWSKFLKVDVTQLNHFPLLFIDFFEAWSFFIEEEKKMVVVYGRAGYICQCTKACIIREDGYFKTVNLEKPYHYACTENIFFSSYVPSLVQLPNKKEGDY